MTKDISVGAVGVNDLGQVFAGNLNKGSIILNKPSYLIILNPAKLKRYEYFITIDRPEYLNGFIQVKGVYSEASEEESIKNYAEILTSSPKENFQEMLFPNHRVTSIKSLVFKQK